ncbi:helix-turn-helix domain-containing protein [Serratia nevei]|uniref:helix-turn-helix domain-containing protein n=1 Tax=Serratia nevei TaxID=2703794 RepID=UPI001A2B9665|nr:helix-turn-helix domain-containing protein [Serratia marcescens]
MTTAAPAANNVATPFVKSYTGIKSVLRFTTKEGQTVEFKHHAKDVYLYLLGWEENKGVSEIYPSRSRIAEETGYSLDSVKRALNFLKEHGFIFVGKKIVHSVIAGVRNTQEVNLYTVASLQEALAIISGEGKGNKNAASRPAREGKPQLHVVQDQEQPNDDHGGDAGDHVQHDVTDSEQPDVINTSESTEVTELQNEGVSVDSILPVDDCDHDDSDAVTAAEPDQLDQQMIEAEKVGLVIDMVEVMRFCRGDREKAAMRLRGEIKAMHTRTELEAQGAAQASDWASNNDSYDDGYSIDDDWNPEDGDAY